MTQPDSPEGTGLTRRELRELRAREWAAVEAAASEEHPFVTDRSAEAPAVAREPAADPFVAERAVGHEEPFIGVQQTRPSAPTREPEPAVRQPERAAVQTSIGTLVAEDEHASGELNTLLTTGTNVVGPKKRRRGAIVIILVILALIAGVAFGGYWAVQKVKEAGGPIAELLGWNSEPTDYESGLSHGGATIMIEKGDTGWEISQKLHEAGVTLTGSVFYNMLVDMQQNPNFVPGAYQLQLQMTAASALSTLQDPSSKLPGIAYPEGYTVEQAIPIIASGLSISEDEVRTAVESPADYGVDADSLEGWLFPTSYDFTPNTEVTTVIQGMVDRTRESLTRAGVPAGEEQQVLTIASIIQREAAADDFYKVSTVIENRLAIDMKLQMDSTAQYGAGEIHSGSVYSSQEALDDDNAWNTYVHTGLPVGPIANPGDAAINAAMNPEDGKWLYFVAVDLETGETKFSETYNEQLRNEAELRAWCADHSDNRGCS